MCHEFAKQGTACVAFAVDKDMTGLCLEQRLVNSDDASWIALKSRYGLAAQPHAKRQRTNRRMHGPQSFAGRR